MTNLDGSGGLEEQDPHRLVEEALETSLDEAKAGHVGLIQLRLHADGSCSVQDDGRGIPVGMHVGEGIRALEVVLCTLHTGTESGFKSYRVAPDLYGNGLTAVNALSEWLEATVWRDGFEWFLRTERAVPVKPTERRAPTKLRGTKIRFKPGLSAVGDASDLDFDRLSGRLGELAVLHKGVRFQVSDERSGRSSDFQRKPDGVL